MIWKENVKMLSHLTSLGLLEVNTWPRAKMLASAVFFSLSFSHFTFILFHFSVPSTSSPPAHISLFNFPVLTNTDDLSGSQTASRPQTFHSQVTMATAPPPFHQPRTTVSQPASTLPLKPPFTPPPLGSTAASGRPPQQAAHAETQDKGTKRVFVSPMTPQPLQIRGAAPQWNTHRHTLCSRCTSGLLNAHI